jgi:hypothetical protein
MVCSMGFEINIEEIQRWQQKDNVFYVCGFAYFTSCKNQSELENLKSFV